MEYLQRLWNKYNPFDLGQVLQTMVKGFEDIEDKLSKVQATIDTELVGVSTELKFYKSLVSTIGDTLPDMMWLKGLDGRYIYANHAIKVGLLFDVHPVGKTDVEIATRAKEVFGKDNHTFGEKCANSDKEVIEHKVPMRFLESGKIKGKMVYLEVFKAPMYQDGEMVGVCGTGRDMTEYVIAYRTEGCSKCPSATDIFKRYEFEE